MLQREGIWPVTATGWVSLIGLGLGVLASLWAFAKGMARLNGLGDRVNAIERSDAEQNGHLVLIDRFMDRSSDDRAVLHREVGESRRMAEECKDDIQTTRADIVGAIHDMQRAMTDQMGAMRERVRALEAIIERRDAPRPRQ